MDSLDKLLRLLERRKELKIKLKLIDADVDNILKAHRKYEMSNKGGSQ